MISDELHAMVLTMSRSPYLQAIFLTHQGFAGCLGAHLCSTPYRLGWKGSVYTAPKPLVKPPWTRVANLGKLVRLWLKGLEKDGNRCKK